MLWFQRKTAIQKMVPLLAVYKGMITVTAMEKYLLLAPSKCVSQMQQVG